MAVAAVYQPRINITGLVEIVKLKRGVSPYAALGKEFAYESTIDKL